MTVREYLTGKFGSFGIKFTDADFADISASVDLSATFTENNRLKVYKQLAEFVIPQLLLRPKTVSENGFTISYDNDALMKYYAWLCQMAGVENVFASSIVGRSDMW